MSKKESILFFANSYFGEIDKKTFCYLEEVCRFKIFKKKEIIFNEDQAGKKVYFLTSGIIKLYKTDIEGREVAISFIKAGQIFGALVLWFNGYYPVSAEALEEIEVLSFSTVEFDKMLQTHHRFAIEMLKYLALRQKFYINSIKDLAVSCPRTRLLNYFDYFAESSGSKNFSLPVPKKQIALLLGITPETLSRLLHMLAKEKVIEMNGKNIKLHYSLSSPVAS